MIVAPATLSQAEPQAPKQTKLLGATVAGLGTITTVSVQNVWRWALVEDATGREHHVFLCDLKRDQLALTVEPRPYREVNRRIGVGLWEECYELLTQPFSDLTHIDTLERAA